MSTGVRPVYYSTYQSYPLRQAPSGYQYPVRNSILPNYYGQTNIQPPGGGGYQPQLLTTIKQQLGPTVINTSRVPVNIQQLLGKQDGEAVEAVPYSSLPHTGVSTVDGALQRTGSVASYIPQAFKNVASTSVKDAFYAGAGASVLTVAGVGIGKLTGRFKTMSGMAIAGSALAMGTIGFLIGGLVGFIRSIFQTIKDIKDIALGNRV